MATGAADMMLRCMSAGSISIHAMEIGRRPYHRNCSCALHKLKGACPNACAQHRCISYRRKQSRHDCSLTVAAPKFLCRSSSFNDLPFRTRRDTNEALSSREKFWPCLKEKDRK